MRSRIRLSRPMIIMLILLTALFGAIFAYKAFVGMMTQRFIANKFGNVIVTVSATKAEYSPWQPKVKASASLRAVAGVNITTSLAGMVQTIYFTPGSSVTKGQKLVQLNADSEIGQLQSLQAQVELAKITFERDKAQFKILAVSKQQVQADEQNLKSLQGQVAQQAAIVAKKSITAPFNGRLGVSLINLGQYINPGDAIVSLQTLNPIWADFYIPQKEISLIKTGQIVTLTNDAYQSQTFKGKVTTIDSFVDPATRNIKIEATIENPKLELTPGMFASVEVSVGSPRKYLTVPQTAISYNPYGDLVFIITEEGKDKEDKPILTAHQRFVTLGATRGDQVAVLSGLKAGERVVTSGQLKLKNGSRVTINNSVVPLNQANPKLQNEY